MAVRVEGVHQGKGDDDPQGEVARVVPRLGGNGKLLDADVGAIAGDMLYTLYII